MLPAYLVVIPFFFVRLWGLWRRSRSSSSTLPSLAAHNAHFYSYEKRFLSCVESFVECCKSFFTKPNVARNSPLTYSVTSTENASL